MPLNSPTSAAQTFPSKPLFHPAVTAPAPVAPVPPVAPDVAGAARYVRGAAAAARGSRARSSVPGASGDAVRRIRRPLRRRGFDPSK